MADEPGLKMSTDPDRDVLFSTAYTLPDTPEALKDQLREAEANLADSRKRLTIAQQNVALAESGLQDASRAYIQALESALEARPESHQSLPSQSETADELLVMDVLGILKQLDSQIDKKRLEAENEMRALGVRAVAPLLRVIEREAARRDQWSIVVASLSVFAIMLSFLGFVTESNSRGGPLYFMLLILLLSLLNTTRPTRLQKRAAQELANYDDARVIGPLADGLELNDHFTRSVASTGLKRLLPRVRASDAVHVSRDHLTKLYRALGTSDHKLTLAILQGLEQIGDENAIPHVEKLANSPAVSEQERKVRAAARECLPMLQTRLLDNPGATLLRATNDPGSPDVLLRSTSPMADANSDVLLRSVGPDGNKGS